MTESTTPGTAPAGWYPTAPGSPELRWWDGAQWTSHSHTLGVDSGQPLRAPEGTTTGTPWIWIFAVLPLLQLTELPFIATFYTHMLAAGLQNSAALLQAEYAPGSGYLVIQGLGILFWAAYVVLGLLDYLALRRRGVPRPFHWAWGFLSGLVYMIGRTVVVRRRTGSGMAPLWVNIVAQVAAIVIMVSILVPIVTAAMASLH